MKTRKTKSCTLIPVMDNIWTVKEEPSVDLVFSEDDNGYYFQIGRDVSIVFDSLYLAVRAYKTKREKIFN